MSVKQVLYGDILFFVNFSMDFLTLYITASILKRKLKPLRLVISAVLGAIYGVAACFVNVIPAVSLIINAAISFFMCYLAFGGKKLLSCCALFYGAGCFLGGIMTAVFSLIGSVSGSHTVFVDGEYHTLSGDIPLGWMAVIAVITALAAILGGQYAKRKSLRPDIEIKITVFGKSRSLSGVCDSGNLLTEPSTGKPVIIITESAARELLPPELAEVIVGGDIMKMPQLDGELAKKVKIIPSESVGGKTLLLGFVPDSVHIENIEKSAVIACSAGIESFDSRDALLPSELCF